MQMYSFWSLFSWSFWSDFPLENCHTSKNSQTYIACKASLHVSRSPLRSPGNLNTFDHAEARWRSRRLRLLDTITYTSHGPRPGRPAVRCRPGRPSRAHVRYMYLYKHIHFQNMKNSILKNTLIPDYFFCPLLILVF